MGIFKNPLLTLVNNIYGFSKKKTVVLSWSPIILLRSGGENGELFWEILTGTENLPRVLCLDPLALPLNTLTSSMSNRGPTFPVDNPNHSKTSREKIITINILQNLSSFGLCLCHLEPCTRASDPRALESGKSLLSGFASSKRPG